MINQAPIMMPRIYWGNNAIAGMVFGDRALHMGEFYHLMDGEDFVHEKWVKIYHFIGRERFLSLAGEYGNSHSASNFINACRRLYITIDGHPRKNNKNHKNKTV